MNSALDIFYSYTWIERTDKFHFGIIRNAFDFSGNIVEIEIFVHRKLWLRWHIAELLTLSMRDIEMYEYYFILDQIRIILNKDSLNDIKRFIKYE